MALLNILYIAAAVVFLFGAAIFIHEFGHFWVARRRGLKVEAFAIGFGPKVYSWTRDGVEYSWRLIPAGGYVKIPQMHTADMLEGESTAKNLPPASPFSRILVAFAGPLMNVIFAFAIATVIYFVGLPVPSNPSIVGYVDPASPEYKAGIREGDEIVKVNGEKASSWQDVFMHTILARSHEMPVEVKRGDELLTFTLTAEKNEMVGLKMLNLNPKEHPVLNRVIADGPAAKAGLQDKDEILSFANVPIVSRDQFIDLVKKRPNEATPIVVKRGDQQLTLSVTPMLDPSQNVGRISVEIGGSTKDTYRVQKPGPTPWAQITSTLTQMKNVIMALVHSKQTGVKASDLSGPVGILSGLAIQVNTDFRLALNFLVLLNVNLAVLNLLPVPVLDGRHILMALLERVRRRPLSVRFVEYTTTAFAVLLISFMLYVTFFDVKRFPLFKSMFTRETHIEQTQTPTPAPAP